MTNGRWSPPPCLTLLRADAGQREHSLRAVVNGLRDVVKMGAPWRWMPQRPSALGGRLPAGAALAGGRVLRATGRGSAGPSASGLRTFARAAFGHPRQPDPALLTRERRAGRTAEKPAKAARVHGIEREVAKPPETKRGFVLLPRRGVVERSFAWATHFRRLVEDDERDPSRRANLPASPSPASCTNRPLNPRPAQE